MNTVQNVDAAPSGNEIDLRELLGILLDRKWLIISITAFTLLASAAYAFLAPPVYLAQAMVQVESEQPSIPGLADLTSLEMGTSSPEAATEIALINSRSVIGSAVQDMNLDTVIEPYRFPVFGNFIARRFVPATPGQVASPVLGLDSFGWGGEILNISRLTVPNSLMGTDLMLKVDDTSGGYSFYDEDGNLLLKGNVGVAVQGRGVTLLVSKLAANPGMRFQVNELPTLNVIANVRDDMSVAESSSQSGILQLSYKNEDANLAQTFLQKVAEAYVKQNIERNSAKASSQLRFVTEQLPNVRKQAEAAQAAMSAYQTRSDAVDISLQTKGLLDQAVAVETSIQELRMKQAEMDRSFTSAHPAYKALMKQIGELEARKRQFQGQVNNLPDKQQELLRLTRDVDVSNGLYTSLLNQAQQLDVARAGTVGNVRIVDPAAVDMTSPVWPRKLLVLVIGALLGGLLAVGYVFLQRMFNPGIEEPAQVEDLGLPVYAAIPLSSSKTLLKLQNRGRADGRPHLLAIDDPTDSAVEAIRSLRTSLHFAMLEAKNNILVISGSRPEVGKTFVSANLAAVVAQAGQKVLLIDGDMRKGAVHRMLGAAPSNGLSDVLAGKTDADTAIHKVPGLEQMHYLVRGGIPPNPSELLMHPNFSRLLERLGPRYDLIIFDTPPILAVTDAAIIAQYAGSNLLVTRFGVNQPKELLLVKKRFEQNGLQIKGAIFNAVEPRSTGYPSYGQYEYKPDAA